MGKKLYVGGISYDTTEDGLKEAFAQAGNVTSAMIIKDRETGRSKGFGFVEYATDEEAAKGIEMWNGKELDGRALRVNEARPMAPRTGGGAGGFGGRGRGGYGGGGGRGGYGGGGQGGGY
jgi:RNA recognition motif-containing protein